MRLRVDGGDATVRAALKARLGAGVSELGGSVRVDLDGPAREALAETVRELRGRGAVVRIELAASVTGPPIAPILAAARIRMQGQPPDPRRWHCARGPVRQVQGVLADYALDTRAGVVWASTAGGLYRAGQFSRRWEKV